MRERSALLSLFLCSLFVAPASQSSAAGPAVANLADNGPVLRYGKLELTFTLGTAYSNPFDPAAIDVSVQFTGPGGVTRTVNAFWYRAYTRSGDVNNETLTPTGTGVWKARLAPHLAGQWDYQISATDATGTATVHSSAPVTVLSSSSHGFIRVSATDPSYFAYDDGTVYLPLGENVAWAGSGRTYQYDQWLDQLAAQGGNFARVWMAPWDMAIDWDYGHLATSLGNYGSRMAEMWDLDHLFEKAEANGQAVMLCLLQHGEFSTLTDPEWADNIYSSAWGGPLASPDLVWTNATARTLMKRRWRYLVARYAYSTSLHSWELWNEMEWTDAYAANVASSAAWHQEMRDAIRALDPNQHLITTSYAHGTDWGASVYGAGMELSQTHVYGATDWAQLAADTTAQFRAAYPGKPFHLGEFGLDVGNLGQDPTGLSIAETAWGAVMSKAASGGAPWWWDIWVPTQNLYWRWKGISTFLAGEDLDQHGYSPVRPIVTTATRADASVNPAGPGWVSGWVKSPASAFTLDQNGQLSPDASQLGPFLHGSWNPAVRNPPTFSVNYAVTGTFKVVVGGVSAFGSNSMVIRLDGGTPSTFSPVAVGTYSIPVPAGAHTILVDSTGQDWVQVSQYVLTNYTGLLRCYALSGSGKVLGWVQSRNDTYWNQCPACQGGTAVPLPTVGDGVVHLTGLSADGTWNVTFYETTNGTVASTTTATAAGGALGLAVPSMNRDLAFKLVSAGGAPPPRTLTVTEDGAGTGTVTSSPAGITCGATCSYDFTDGTPVTLSAAPSAGSVFSGWTGEGCSGLGTCLVTMSAARSVKASFALAAAVSQLLAEPDVTVGSMVSDRFTWRDSAGQARVAVLAHNDGQTGPGGTRGGELREYRYQAPGGTRVVQASSSAYSGFGYVVSHPDGGEACMAGPDSSALGHFSQGTFTRVFTGKHHAIFRFTQLYPRTCSTAVAPPATPIDVPVTVDWVFGTGRDNPLWAVTLDVSGIPVNTLNDDSRGPYGELLFDGSATEAGHSAIAGVGWGDKYKFLSTTNPVTFGSAWTWNTPNTVPYVKLWTTAVDATMGTVLTQTMDQQDAGGYWGIGRWDTTSAAGYACGATYRMPCDYNWPYQSINYSLAGSSPTNNTRLAWGTNFGFLGQQSYMTNGSTWYGGPGPDTTAPGWPRKSYSTYVVLGTHTSAPVEAQVGQVETIQSLTLSATAGAVVTSGPAGAGRPDSVTYAPPGYNHVYGALAFSASGNALDANIAVGTGTLARPLLVVGNYAGSDPTVKLGGVSLVPDVDYFLSSRPAASELWITLNRNLTGAANHLEIVPPSACAPPTPTITPSGATTFCAGGSVTLTASIAPGAGISYLWSPGGQTTPSIQATVSGSYSVSVTVNGCTGGSPAVVVTVNPIPALPVIQTVATLTPATSGWQASVTALAGSTYQWAITNGTVDSGGTTNQISYTSGASGSVTLKVVETVTATGCASTQATVSVPVVSSGATRFTPLPPCRIFDTRSSSGSDAAAPILAAGATRTFDLTGRCGIPASARAISVNVTVTGQVANGELVVFRGDLATSPGTTNLSFSAGRTRANNAILELSRTGSMTVNVFDHSTSDVHFILDVNGSFQ